MCAIIILVLISCESSLSFQDVFADYSLNSFLLPKIRLFLAEENMSKKNQKFHFFS